MQDIRDTIFRNIINKQFAARITAENDGCFSGAAAARKVAEEIGITLHLKKEDGQWFKKDECLIEFVGTPKEISMAEEKLIGSISKYCGIATAAQKTVALADGHFRIVAGAWKKMPWEIKEPLRNAIASGGASFRIANNMMIYLDKNYIRMFGSIEKTLEAVKDLTGFTKVIQIKGIWGSIEEETRIAAQHGCNLFMVDTGSIEDLRKCLSVLKEFNIRDKVEVALAGGISQYNIKDFFEEDIDVVCIGKAIVDAPVIDMKLDVITNEGGNYGYSEGSKKIV